MNSFNYKSISDVPDFLIKLIKELKPINEKHTITIFEVNDMLNELCIDDMDKWPHEDSGSDRMD
jgi:hypothetical protein